MVSSFITFIMYMYSIFYVLSISINSSWLKYLSTNYLLYETPWQKNIYTAALEYITHIPQNYCKLAQQCDTIKSVVFYHIVCYFFL